MSVLAPVNDKQGIPFRMKCTFKKDVCEITPCCYILQRVTVYLLHRVLKLFLNLFRLSFYFYF